MLTAIKRVTRDTPYPTWEICFIFPTISWNDKIFISIQPLKSPGKASLYFIVLFNYLETLLHNIHAVLGQDAAGTKPRARCCQTDTNPRFHPRVEGANTSVSSRKISALEQF